MGVFKTIDRLGVISVLKRHATSIVQFFATKQEMDVVATSLCDLDRRIDEAIPTIAIGSVTTGAEGTEASVTNRGTDKQAVFDFVIPRGATGDMHHHRDKETDSSGKVIASYCKVGNIWGIKTNSAVSYDYADYIQLPIPSVSAMKSLADCISMDYEVKLYVEDSLFSYLYTWSNLHWQLQRSNSNGIVYATRYSTSDADFYFAFDNGKNTAITDLSTIDIAVRYENGACYVQATIENSYGRAYYRGSGIITQTI